MKHDAIDAAANHLMVGRKVFTVVWRLSFDGDMLVKVFSDYDKADAFLKEDFEKTLEVERRESVIGVNEEETSCGDGYATLTWNDDTYADWSITECEVE